MDSQWSFFVIGLLLSYVFGSIPFGLILCKIMGFGDITKKGSKNIGATNVLRVSKNKQLALLVLLADFSKGIIPFLLFAIFYTDDMAIFASLLAVVGHNYSIFLKFKGGKGVSSTIGMLLVANPTVLFLSITSWLLVALIFRYSSLASIVFYILTPVYALFVGNLYLLLAVIILSLIGLIKHKENFIRLIKGQETKIKLRNEK